MILIAFYVDKNTADVSIDVFPLMPNRVESLFDLSFETVLMNHSINDLKQMNLPKSIKKYFADSLDVLG